MNKIETSFFEYLKGEFNHAVLDMELFTEGTPEYYDAQRRAAKAGNTCATVLGFSAAAELQT